LVAPAPSQKVTPTLDQEPGNRKRTRVTASTTPLESTATYTPPVDSAFLKRSKHEEMSTTTAIDFESQRPLPQQELLPSFDAIPPAGAQAPTPVKAQQLPDCQGLVLDRLIKRSRSGVTDSLEEAYRLVVAEAIHNFAAVVSRDQPWHLDIDRFCGVRDIRVT
jgi:hypothetical protein